MWSKDQNGWTGLILPVFSIYRSKKKLYLDIMEPDCKPECAHRNVEIKSVHQGKCIAKAILKARLTS